MLPVDEAQQILWSPTILKALSRCLQGTFKQMDLEQAPEIIMEMTQKLGFRELRPFYQLFVKDVRDVGNWDGIRWIA